MSFVKYIYPALFIMAASFATPASAGPSDNPTILAPATDAGSVDDDLSLIGCEDFIMPSLEEFLGAKFDNLGYVEDFADIKRDMVQYAKNYIGTRYRRGASGPNAFDCSGFTSYVFKKFGMNLSRVSSAQGTQGEAVSLADAQVGDLIFFSGRRVSKRIGHVGIVIDVNKETGALKFIHASTSRGIRIENFPDGGYYAKRFISVRRVLGQPGMEVASK